ncbi:MAG TPA: ferritin-like domain-containing protein [Mycobacteriales bacterium]|nr:ferritin-like domain-containing protein [Mycobacteriales bacterium]
MSTHEVYAMPVERETWDVPLAGSARFSWEYGEGRERLLALYAKGKASQWDAATRIDWALPVEPGNPLGTGVELLPIYGSKQYEKLNAREVDEMRQHTISWQFSQFLHGEQGAAICSARIVESVPDLDAKFYAATQTIDEARHAEAYARFLQEKVQLVYPINPHLKALLDNTLTDNRWDMPYLGMQVLIEGLALAAFGILRDVAQAQLPKQILAYVMQDEARHVAFGRLALRDYYSGLTRHELDEREEFVVEACYLMRDRFRAEEVWTNLQYDVVECLEFVDHSPIMKAFRSHLFSRIVPCVRDIGLWGPRVQKAYADMGVLDMAGVDLDALMSDDERIAVEIDEARDLERRRADVDAVIDLGRVR